MSERTNELGQNKSMILMIDNYDSFTYNIVQYLGELGCDVEVFRNDKITLEQIEEKGPSHLFISPGPCTPKEAGISMDTVAHFAGRIPIFGVCLGHQSIVQSFGGYVGLAPQIMHGKTSAIYHKNKSVFAGLPSPFTATRYHSLIADPAQMPDELEVTAWTEDKEIMAIAHKTQPIVGVQFHPESIMTEHGHQMLKTFLDCC